MPWRNQRLVHNDQTYPYQVFESLIPDHTWAATLVMLCRYGLGREIRPALVDWWVRDTYAVRRSSRPASGFNSPYVPVDDGTFGELHARLKRSFPYIPWRRISYAVPGGGSTHGVLHAALGACTLQRPAVIGIHWFAGFHEVGWAEEWHGEGESLALCLGLTPEGNDLIVLDPWFGIVGVPNVRLGDEMPYVTVGERALLRDDIREGMIRQAILMSPLPNENERAARAAAGD